MTVRQLRSITNEMTAIAQGMESTSEFADVQIFGVVEYQTRETGLFEHTAEVRGRQFKVARRDEQGHRVYCVYDEPNRPTSDDIWKQRYPCQTRSTDDRLEWRGSRLVWKDTGKAAYFHFWNEQAVPIPVAPIIDTAEAEKAWDYARDDEWNYKRLALLERPTRSERKESPDSSRNRTK